MRTIPLGGGRSRRTTADQAVALIDDADFDRINAFVWRLNQRGQSRYAMRMSLRSEGEKRRNISMHRAILGYGPADPGIDHIDGNGLNNQRANLRASTQAQNLANQRKQVTYLGRPTTSQYRGVYVGKSKRKPWTAAIKVRGQYGYLGTFDSEEAAARAYDAAARAGFGEFARLNFP